MISLGTLERNCEQKLDRNAMEIYETHAIAAIVAIVAIVPGKCRWTR